MRVILAAAGAVLLASVAACGPAHKASSGSASPSTVASTAGISCPPLPAAGGGAVGQKPVPAGGGTVLTAPALCTSYGTVTGACLAALRSDSETKLTHVVDGFVRPSQCAGVKNGAIIDAAQSVGLAKWPSF